MTDRDFTKLENRIRTALTEEAAIIPPLEDALTSTSLPDDFDAFYAAQRGRLYRALVLSLRDRDLATEAVDVGMARSFQRWRRVKGAEADTAAYAAAFKWAAKRTERPGETQGFRLQRAERSADAVAAETAFAKLSLSDRSVIVARRYVGWDDDAVAKAHDIQPISVARRFDAAIAKIATELKVAAPEADHRVSHALRSEARDLVEPLGRPETVRGRAWLQRIGVAAAAAAAVLVVIGGGAWVMNTVRAPETPPAEVAVTGLTGQPEATTSQLASAAASGQIEWSQVPLPISQGDISSIVSGPAGFVAFGQSWTGPGQSIALLSEDGFSWEELVVPLPQNAWINSTNTSPNGYLVAANAYDDLAGRESTLLLASDDGVTWQTYALPEAPDFVGGLNVYTYTSVNSVELADDGSVSVTAFRGGDIENLDALLREVAPEGFNPQWGWGSSPNGVDIYDEQGLVKTIPWDEFNLDQEVIDVISGSLVLWTTDELGGEWTETRLNVPGTVGQSWIMGLARVEGGFVAAVSGEMGAGTLWQYTRATDEWTRADLDRSVTVTSITRFNDTVVAAGSEGGQAIILTSKDGVAWTRAGGDALPEGTIERIVASSGGLAAVVNRSNVLSQEAVLTAGDYSIGLTQAGIFTVTDVEGVEVAQIFNEDAVRADGTITLLDPDTDEPLASFTQRDVELAWEQVWREADFEGQTGPTYDIAISADGTTWTQINLDEVTGGGFYPQSLAMDRGVVILTGYQEEGGGFLGGRFEGPPSPVLWVASFDQE